MITNLLNQISMKTINAIKSTILLIAMLAISSVSSAQDISQVRETGEFSAINAGSIFKIELVQGENNFVEVHTEEKFLENIHVDVKNGVLHLDFKGTVRNAKASVTVVAPVINSIKLSGAASLTSETTFETPSMEIDLSGASSAKVMVMTPSLDTKVSGAANLRISGEAETHTARISGAAQLRAAELLTQTTNVNASGASYAKVNVLEYLEANASGSSKVAYENEPAAKKLSRSGAGSVSGANASTSNTDLGDTTRIRIGNRDLLVIDDAEKSTRSRRRKSFHSNWAGFEMGINGYMAPEYNLNLSGEANLIDVRYEKSFVYNLNLFQQNFNLIGNNLGLFTGIGVGFNNYRFDNQTRISQDREGVILTETDEADMKYIRNKLHLTYINVPLMLEFQTGGNRQAERFHIAGGVIVGARVRTNTKYVYEDNGKNRKERDYNDFHIAPFKFDLSARIGWGRVNLFATYSLNTLFKEGKGPELYPFTVGLRLVSF
jgi:hypothetical protein